MADTFGNESEIDGLALVREEKLTDGSPVYSVILDDGDHARVQIDCVSKSAANALASAYNQGALSYSAEQR